MRDIKFKPGTRTEADQWTIDGEKITSSENLSAIKAALEKDGPIVASHAFLRGGCGSHTFVTDDFDEFVEYLENNARSGDQIKVWCLWPFMRDTKPIASGKCPAEDGAVPLKGPY